MYKNYNFPSTPSLSLFSLSFFLSFFLSFLSFFLSFFLFVLIKHCGLWNHVSVRSCLLLWSQLLWLNILYHIICYTSRDMHADILWLSVQRWSTFMQFINAHANLRSSEDWTHNQLYLHDTLNPFITSVISSCSYFHPSSRMLILWNDASLCNLKCPSLLKR